MLFPRKWTNLEYSFDEEVTSISVSFKLPAESSAQLTLQTNWSAVWLSLKKDSAWTMCTHDVQNDSIEIAQQALTAQQ